VPTTFEQLRAMVVAYLPKLAFSVVVLIVFWLLASGAWQVVRQVGAARGLHAELTQLIARIVRATILVFGAVTALGTAGVDVAALVAGLGLTGFALGFALKDVISNVLAGILILFYKPFDYGDLITVTSFQGRVSDIDLRYTTLDAQERKFFVPNSMLFTNAITVEKGSSGTYT
jgi:small-conductance mechanosensitive channel